MFISYTWLQAEQTSAAAVHPENHQWSQRPDQRVFKHSHESLNPRSHKARVWLTDTIYILGVSCCHSSGFSSCSHPQWSAWISRGYKLCVYSHMFSHMQVCFTVNYF